MVLGVRFSRVAHVSHAVRRVSVRALVVSVIVLNMAATMQAVAQNSTKKDGDHNQKDECPPETQQKPRNCDDVRRIAYMNALRRGYANINGNGIPDVMERPYQVGWNDCSTGNAHVACMFNDPCTEQHGTLMGLRSQSAWHATTLYKARNGQDFECDFTPQSSGIMIADRGDTQIGMAFPDAGESIDPQYAKDGCVTNGASTTALNPGGGLFGGGGGSMQDMMMMMAIMQLLNGNQNQNSPQSPVDGQPGSNEVVIPTPTVTPTPSPVPTRTSDSRGTSSNTSTEISDADIVSSDEDAVRDDSSDSKGSLNGDTIDDEVTAAETRRTAEWELKREGMF